MGRHQVGIGRNGRAAERKPAGCAQTWAQPPEMAGRSADADIAHQQYGICNHLFIGFEDPYTALPERGAIIPHSVQASYVEHRAGCPWNCLGVIPLL
jgi:hypothetical protein